jgi:NAD-dependent dihydropyrimidine dehydrogenase PreA subunit
MLSRLLISLAFCLTTIHRLTRIGGRSPLPCIGVTYVINEPCIGVKDHTCVEVCPVDCIHPTNEEPDWDDHEQLYINPDECIDCDACVEVCPVDAITPEDEVPEEWRKFIQINAAYYTPSD